MVDKELVSGGPVLRAKDSDVMRCFSFMATGAGRAGHLRHPNPVQETNQSYLAGADLGEDGTFRFVQPLVQA